jgi:prepilin-type N-terminal cleavage/methylation domain-containing protein
MPAARLVAPHFSNPRRTHVTTWTAPPFGHAPPFRRGVSLMELLLVLVLLVIAGSIAVPAITGAFGGAKLKRTGDKVIARWAEARAQAIETGVPYQFRFTPNTNAYRIEPLAEVLQSGASSAGGPTTSSTPEPATAAQTETDATRRSLDKTTTIESQLPETILFVGGQAAGYDAATDERRVDDLQAIGSSWSSPIIFFPDGSASTATVVLQNDVPQYLRLTIRGLTGVARASGVLNREEYDAGARTQ